MGTGARTARALLPPRLLVAAGNFADVFGAGRAHALRRLIGDDHVMHRLRAFSVFNQRELYFEFALLLTFDIFNGNFHGRSNYFLTSATAAGLGSAFAPAPFFFIGAKLTGGFQPLGRFLDSRMMT